MNRMVLCATLGALFPGLFPAPAAAQVYEVLGTRAAGMAGAFVAVADDASAVYWNPAALASGAFFSLVLDRTTAETDAEGQLRAGSGSGVVFSAAIPALGVSYYRLRATTLSPPVLDTAGTDLTRDLTAVVRLQTLITHHAGATLVQSLTDRIAVGATLKLVRGIAAVEVASDADRPGLLSRAGSLVGAASNRFDADIGVLATFRAIRTGLTLRNVTQPEFRTAGDTERLRLERQARAGVAATPRRGLTLAADLDLQRTAGFVGQVRNLAFGGEAQLSPRAAVRGGARLNTLANQPAGRTPVVSAGGTVHVRGWMLIDGQVTAGSELGGRGWGLAARVVF